MVPRQRPVFQEILRQVLEEDRPLSYSQLQGLSNPSADELRAWSASWPAALPERRRQIVRAMAQLSEDNPDLYFRDVLMVALADPDETVRLVAIEGLGDDESFDLLETLLGLAAGDPSSLVRSQAILALGRFVYLIETTDLLSNYRQRVLRLLLETYGDAAAPLEVRRRALETVSFMCALPEVEEAIQQAYAAPQREMRVSAIHAMGHNMAQRWRPFIERELASGDAEMRYEAACACGEMADPELLEQLMPLLDDDDHEVAGAAIWALGEIGGARARRLLERCLQSEEEDIREAADEALHTLQFFEDPMRIL